MEHFKTCTVHIDTWHCLGNMNDLRDKKTDGNITKISLRIIGYYDMNFINVTQKRVQGFLL
jgi:hypothetical protein